jgi:1-acyl-sn-glycerol-3-phosphate acyltransferase
VSLEVRGRANAQGIEVPCLVVSNHTSMLDAPTVAFALPAGLRGRISPAMAIETLPDHFDPEGKPWRRRLRSGSLYAVAAGLFGAYPLPQSQGFRPSLEYTGELLDAGLLPLVFPEGRMTRTGRMLPFKSGIGLLVRETRCAVLPVHLTGLAEILPPDARWPRGRGHATARIGPVLRFDDLAGLEAGAVARRIETAVLALGPSPEKSRDRGTDGG